VNVGEFIVLEHVIKSFILLEDEPVVHGPPHALVTHEEVCSYGPGRAGRSDLYSLAKIVGYVL
jgi:hypothetical protein